MTSCGGMLIVTVRSDTRTIRSTNGMRNVSPGPRVAITRPSRKTTPRSYSMTTRIEIASRTTRTSTASSDHRSTSLIAEFLSSHAGVTRGRQRRPVWGGAPGRPPAIHRILWFGGWSGGDSRGRGDDDLAVDRRHAGPVPDQPLEQRRGPGIRDGPGHRGHAVVHTEGEVLGG